MILQTNSFKCIFQEQHVDVMIGLHVHFFANSDCPQYCTVKRSDMLSLI